MIGSEDETPHPVSPKLVVNQVSKRFKSGRQVVQALQDIDLRVDAGQFVCLVGPSGCGKTTLLNIIAGLDKPDTGEVLVDGRPVTGPGHERMALFQEPSPFPWLTATGNVLFGLKLNPNLTRSERKRIAQSHLQLIGLQKFARASIHELSGGMKQRVALARALAPNPSVLLMDEPIGALDALTRERLYQDVETIWQQQQKTIVFVTHNVREAVCLGDRVLLLSPSPGHIRQAFEIKLPRPRDINSAELAGYAADITDALKAELASETKEVTT